MPVSDISLLSHTVTKCNCKHTANCVIWITAAMTINWRDVQRQKCCKQCRHVKFKGTMKTSRTQTYT